MSEDFIYQEVREVLLKSDWQSEDLLFEPVMYVRGRVYRPDIVLLYNLYPLAVAEIKRNLDSPELVTSNTKEQAEALEIPFSLITDKTQILKINTLSGESQILVDFPTAKDLWIELGWEWNPNDPRLYLPFRREDRNAWPHQAIAVSRVVEAVVNGKRRIFLAMDFGTGRAWVLFQVAWKLIQSGYCQRMLYLTRSANQLNQMRERFKPFEHNLLVLDKTHPANDTARVQMASVAQVRTIETAHNLLSLPSDFYDLIFLENIRDEKSLLPVLENFPQAIRIALGDARLSVIPPDYESPVFTYSQYEAFETEYAQPPDGFVATRLAEIAEIHLGKRNKDEAKEISNTSVSTSCYLITPQNLLADGTIRPDV